MTGDFPLSFWGIDLRRLDELELECDTVEDIYELSEENCSDIDFESRELAEKMLKENEYPCSNLTNIICEAKMKVLVDKICEVKGLDPEDFHSDLKHPRLFYKGKGV